jgi:KipI family sensor histidine kinase inhibitor
MRLLPCGPTAVVIEVDSTDDAVRLGAWLGARRPDGLVDLVPAARTVLAQFESPASLARLQAELQHYEPGGATAATGRLVEIETVYDGDDLDEVAHALDVSVPELVEIHTGLTFTAAFNGFVPGFAYLTADHPLVRLPRRVSPRPRVPQGSVAVAGGFAGVYPTASPGGWNLLGHTDAVMWDSARPRPALIEPGDRVRFVAVQPAR